MLRRQRGEEFNSLRWSASTRETDKEGRECQGASSLFEVREQVERRLEVVASGEMVDKEGEGSVGRVEGAVADEVTEEIVGEASGGDGRREGKDVAKEGLVEGDVRVVEVEMGMEIEGWRGRGRGGGGGGELG